MPSLNNVKIAVIGAGPAGLTLARLLQSNGISCTVYESEDSRDARSQGGTLDLDAETGQLALREAGLWDEWLKHVHPETEVYKLLDSTGKVYLDENTTGNNHGRNRPEIDRLKLRNILLGSLVPNTVAWGKKLRSVKASADDVGTYNLHFEKGSVEHGFHLVVGADGAWSKVRPLLTREKPFYCGFTAFEAVIHDVRTRHPEMARFIGSGGCLAIDHKRILAARIQDNGCALAYAMLRLPETWNQESGIDWESSTAGEQFIDQHFPTWIQELKDLILKSDEPLLIRRLYMLPVGIEWEHKSGLTLIGDAAHLMSPFAGVGVNVAMEDALRLGRAIISRKDEFLSPDAAVSRNTLSVSVKEYENELFPRAKQNAEMSLTGIETQFSENALQAVLGRFSVHHSSSSN